MVYYTWKSYKLKTGPFEFFSALRDQKNCFFLDSSLNSDGALGRYSFLGKDPFSVFQSKGIDPLPKLRALLDGYKITSSCGLPFLGGAVGYLSYDLGFALEKKLRRKNRDDVKIPDCCFAFYNSAFVFDHLRKVLHLVAVGFPEKKLHLAKILAESNLKEMQKLVSQVEAKGGNNQKRLKAKTGVTLRSNFTKIQYLRAIRKAKDYIRSGDIYQLNLSQRFKARTSLSPFEIYERLRKLSPSYFGAYFDAGAFQILSSSPERFLKLKGDIVFTRPMKGTRPRAEDRAKDALLEKELLKSQKDKAELMMIVDLERNDLGRVCNYDSVKVESLREIEKYSTVFQTTASIFGRLYPHKDRVDLLRAAFPGGSITGCPKIRAMEIIEELEPHRRSIYTGALGYLSFHGDMDLNILIRTILKKGDELYFGSGGGIVADSQPQEEYRETLVKAKAMIEALK